MMADEHEQVLFSFATFANEAVRIDNRFQFLSRKWLYNTSRGRTTEDLRDLREVIKIPIPEEIKNSEDEMFHEKSILVRPIVWRDASGNKTMRAVIEMPQMNFIL